MLERLDDIEANGEPRKMRSRTEIIEDSNISPHFSDKSQLCALLNGNLEVQLDIRDFLEKLVKIEEEKNRRKRGACYKY